MDDKQGSKGSKGRRFNIMSNLKGHERGSFPRGGHERGFDDEEKDVAGHSQLKGHERGSFPRGGHERGFVVEGEDEDVSGHRQLRRHER
jgi:hypothetical protein